jgi:hypothetical protein
MSNTKISNDTILVELIKMQKKNIPPDKKLLYNDLKRISKYLNNSIFGEECSLWNGYVTVIKSDDKSGNPLHNSNSYINFYYSGKKYAIHRLLYINYIGDLIDSEYIKFKCINKGKCCNINHFYKIAKDHDTSIASSPSPSSPVLDSEKPKDSIKKNIIVDFNL